MSCSKRARMRLMLAALVTIGACGCRQDMHNQPKYIPLRESRFFEDHRSERPLVPGTVARGADQLREDTYYYTGKTGGKDVDALPFPITASDLRRGQERFDIYCSPCHGRTGYGDGMIVQRGFRKPPSFHTEALRQLPVGHFFDVMTNGFGAMADYASQVPVRDRWVIVAYIRALQLSQHAAVGTLAADDRSKLPASGTSPDVPVAPPATVVLK